MTKKSFNTALTDIFSSTENSSRNETKKEVLDGEELTRTTLILTSKTYDKIKAIAYWERKLIKDIIEDGLSQIISRYSQEELNNIVEKFQNQ